MEYEGKLIGPGGIIACPEKYGNNYNYF